MKLEESISTSRLHAPGLGRTIFLRRRRKTGYQKQTLSCCVDLEQTLLAVEERRANQSELRRWRRQTREKEED
ncbi:hypothetical protein H5410_052722 [Solanum commersonii]|uniref:Uncharacterized protein n=1 Tax=Solanum commersonii TaxID=4109 RepID=A0A9J5X2Z6_SOLCO|nr:hypothetical protein H5410_052722 [Solanum commersonii]